MTMMVSAKRNRRRGVCAVCGGKSQKLTYTVRKTENGYITADVCKWCLEKMKARAEG